MTHAMLQTPPPQVQVFFDGACPICSREVHFKRKRDRFGRIEWVDIAAPNFDAHAYGLNPAAIQQAMHVRDTDGTLYVGVDAFLQIARTLPPSISTWGFLALLKIPGMMWLAQTYYRWFARNRHRLGRRCTSNSCEIKVHKREEGSEVIFPPTPSPR